MTTINDLLKNMQSDLPVEDRTLAGLMRSLGVERIEFEYAGVGDSGGLDNIVVYDTRSNLMESLTPEMQYFLDALNEGVIEGHVNNLDFNYYNDAGGRVLVALEVNEESLVSINTECIRYYNESDISNSSISMQELRNASINNAHETAENDKMAALIKNILPEGGEIYIEMSGSGDSGDVNEISIENRINQEEKNFTDTDFDALSSAAHRMIRAADFSGYEIDGGGEVSFIIRVNPQGEVDTINGMLLTFTHSEETKHLDINVLDIKYKPETSTRPGF